MIRPRIRGAWVKIVNRERKQGEALSDTVERMISLAAGKSGSGIGDSPETIHVHALFKRYHLPMLNRLMKVDGSISQGLRRLVEDEAVALGVEDPQGRLLELEKELHRVTDEMSALHNRQEALRNANAIRTIATLENYGNIHLEMSSTKLLQFVMTEVAKFKGMARQLHKPDSWFIEQIEIYRRDGTTYEQRIKGESA